MNLWSLLRVVLFSCIFVLDPYLHYKGPVPARFVQIGSFYWQSVIICDRLLLSGLALYCIHSVQWRHCRWGQVRSLRHYSRPPTLVLLSFRFSV